MRGWERKEIDKGDVRKQYERVWEKEMEKGMCGKEMRERRRWKSEDARKEDKRGRAKEKERCEGKEKR
jgi:hypothetical protein